MKISSKKHFEASPSSVVENEMANFVQWFNDDKRAKLDKISAALVKSSITHLYFEIIHPFEDGNGHIGRALAEYALSHTLKAPVLLSLSKIIEKDKKQYYTALKSAQRDLDITEWIIYFSKIIFQAQVEAKQLIEFTVKKMKYFDRFKHQLNERQLKVLQRMFDAGVEGFAGGMTAKKYTAITKASKATATRDLLYLADINALDAQGGGRSTRYELVL